MFCEKCISQTVMIEILFYQGSILPDYQSKSNNIILVCLKYKPVNKTACFPLSLVEHIIK